MTAYPATFVFSVICLSLAALSYLAQSVHF
jgi:hypothetical protein